MVVTYLLETRGYGLNKTLRFGGLRIFKFSHSGLHIIKLELLVESFFLNLRHACGIIIGFTLI